MADWITPDWPAPPNVKAAATLRTGGVSQGAFSSLNLGSHVGDDPAVGDDDHPVGVLPPGREEEVAGGRIAIRPLGAFQASEQIAASAAPYGR